MSELKLAVGRPSEDKVDRQNLKGYKRLSKFRREVERFFKYWDGIVTKKANGKDRYVHSMENFFGEILDKYEELSNTKQKRVFTERHPFKLVNKLTNLTLPTVFPDSEDNADFINIFLNHTFENEQVRS